MAKKRKKDVSRLPVWAQRRICKLESDVLWYKDRCAEMAGASEGNPGKGPPVLLDPYSIDEAPLRLPRGSMVRFMLAEGTDTVRTLGIDCQAREHGGNYVLQVRSAGGDELVIRPEACNAILLKAKRLGAKGGF